MIKSRINLYTAEFRPKKLALSLNQITVAISLGFISIVLITLFSGWQHQSITEVHNKQAKELSQLQAEMAEMETRLAQHKPTAALLEQIKSMQMMQQLKQQLLNELLTRNHQARAGYSNLLQDLAKTQKGPLWLTRIAINGEHLDLDGKTLNSDALPNWLLQFKSLPSLADKQFTTMLMQRNEQQIDFTLRSLKTAKGSSDESAN